MPKNDGSADQRMHMRTRAESARKERRAVKPPLKFQTDKAKFQTDKAMVNPSSEQMASHSLFNCRQFRAPATKGEPEKQFDKASNEGT
jgi:hypothetical protein